MEKIDKRGNKCDKQKKRRDRKRTKRMEGGQWTKKSLKQGEEWKYEDKGRGHRKG